MEPIQYSAMYEIIHVMKCSSKLRNSSTNSRHAARARNNRRLKMAETCLQLKYRHFELFDRHLYKDGLNNIKEGNRDGAKNTGMHHVFMVNEQRRQKQPRYRMNLLFGFDFLC